MILDGGERGVPRSPEHRLLRRLFDHTGPTYFPAQRGASVTQLRALEHKGLAALVRTGPAEVTVLGAHLTARGERHLERLDAAAAHEDLLERVR